MRRIVRLVGLISLTTLTIFASANHSGLTLRLAVSQDEGALTPYAYQTGYPGYELMTLIYDTLFLLDSALNPQPWLATNATVSDDGLTYTVTVRDDATWQDGEPLTSQDVAFTFDYYNEHLLGRFTTLVNKVSSVTTPDDTTVVLTLHDTDPTFLEVALTDIPILPAHLWRGVTEPKSVDTPIGSGPYKLVEYRTDQYYRLEENSSFWGPTPTFDTIIVPIIKDQTATFQALQAGEIDAAARNLSPELVDRFADQRGIAVAAGPGFGSTLLLIDDRNGALADPEVRRVMAGLINYEQLVDNLLLGYGVAGSPSFIPPASPASNAATQEYSRLTPDEAATKLKAAGYAPNSNGVFVNKAGDALDYSLLVYSNNPIRLRAAELIAQDLTRGGFKVSVRTMEPDALDAVVWPDFDVSLDRSFDLAIFGWSAPVAAQARLGALLHSDPSVGNLNLSGYANPEFDALIDSLSSATDSAGRQAVLDAVQEIVATDLPFITLYYQDGIYAYRPGLFDEWVFMAGQGIINKNSFVGR